MAKGKIAIMFVAILTCAAAWADVVPAARVGHFGSAAMYAPGVSVVEPAAVQAAAAAPRAPRDARLDAINWLLGSATSGLYGTAPSAPGPVRSTPALPTDQADGCTAATVTDLPPAPSSLALVLSALASFGAYQGVRSLKRLHLGALPDWYHADAVQIGHSTPLQLEFDYSALPICSFEGSLALCNRPCWHVRREPIQLVLSRLVLLTADPRGPPHIS